MFTVRFLMTALFSLVMLAAPALAETRLEPLSFETATGPHVFQIEIADSPEQRRTGLMYRRTMADDHGMLFDFGHAQDISMWMQNTYVSLDMVFVGEDGRVIRVAEKTEPLSTRIISSEGPARYVVELVAGAAHRIGLKAGDRVVHPRVGPQDVQQAGPSPSWSVSSLMKTYAIAYAAAAVVFLLGDGVWLGLIARGFYRTQMGDLMSPSPNLVAAAAFYVLYLVGVVYFAIGPAIAAGSWSTALVSGALLGLVAYATYDLTALAVIRGFTAPLALVDMAWGAVLTGAAATAGYFAARAFPG